MDEENIVETIEEKSPIVEDNTEDEGPIEKPTPPKKARSEKQRAAFEKAQAALKLKREKERELKAASKKPRGRPKRKQEPDEVAEAPPPPRRSRAQGGRKKT